VSGATFEGSVVFEEPGRRGFAGRAVYEDGPGLVTLTGDPRIVDEGEGSELRASGSGSGPARAPWPRPTACATP